MKFSCDKPETKERARVMHDFMQRCTARGISVTVRLKDLYNPDHGKTEPRLYLAARSTVDSRDPVNLEEEISGDIRDTILVVALQIGLRGSPA